MKHQNYNTNMKKSAIDIYNDLPKDLKNIELNISKEDPIKGFESLLNHYGMVSKYEVEYKDEVQDKPKVEKSPTVNWDGLLNQFNEITGKKAKVVDDKAKKQFVARLNEGYTKNDIVNAITNCYNSEFHKSNGHKNLTLEFISRPDKFAMYFDFKETIVKPQIKNDRL